MFLGIMKELLQIRQSAENEPELGMWYTMREDPIPAPSSIGFRWHQVEKNAREGKRRNEGRRNGLANRVYISCNDLGQNRTQFPMDTPCNFERHILASSS